MCFAPAAVTRRCRSLVSSYSNPAESADPATAACIPVATIWTLNWTNPLLPLQTDALAWKEAWERWCCLFTIPDTPILNGLKLVGLEKTCTLELGVWKYCSEGQGVLSCRWWSMKTFFFQQLLPIFISSYLCIFCVSFAGRL